MATVFEKHLKIDMRVLKLEAAVRVVQLEQYKEIGKGLGLGFSMRLSSASLSRLRLRN